MSFDPVTQTLLNLIKEVGFPTAITLYLLYERGKAMAKMTQANEAITTVI